jgi:alkanesulfonate monooxygenase SsuD/methylene tetrahydromethanopterin reductase-like flavin-dependent oxidoreductase (luciferase family)
LGHRGHRRGARWRTPASFDGRFTRFARVSIDPKPIQQPGPPIWIGGRSDAALTRAGRQGNGWVSYVVTPDRYAQSLAKIHAAAEAARRSLDDFVAAHLTFITVGASRDCAGSGSRACPRATQDFRPLAARGVIGTLAPGTPSDSAPPAARTSC